MKLQDEVLVRIGDGQYAMVDRQELQPVNNGVWDENWNTFWHHAAEVGGVLLPFLMFFLVLGVFIFILSLLDNKLNYVDDEPEDGNDG